MAKTNKNGMPIPTYVRDKKKLAEYFAVAYKDMLDQLLLQLVFNPVQPRVIMEVQIMRQISSRLNKLDFAVAAHIDKTIKKAFKEGQAYHLLSINEATAMDEALSAITFNMIVDNKVEALVADTYGDILLATQNTEEAIKGVVRNTVQKVAQFNAIRNTNYTNQADQLKKELSKKGLSEKIVSEGFVGIVDRMGRKWDLRTYSKMVMTTKVNQAFTEGIRHEATQTGLDLAVISSHGVSKDNPCSKWEGVVISLNGKTEGFWTYEQARATNEIFHPNCEHGLHSIRSLEMLPKEDVEKHKRKMKALGDVSKREYKRKKVKKK
ncbi:phage minor capsid protein [Bacillus sp. NPDC077027]|uniref:phage minor capsid protein n=1 Tax=Bacillus sp. NPDC077027 TaxID=3390548 RepID=UPI003D020104